jgi:PAS domain S-box-containing protein
MENILFVLFIDNSNSDILVVIRQLELSGYIIDYLRVETESAMVEALLAKKWDLILSENLLSSFNAKSAIKVCRQLKVDIPFIIVTGDQTVETAVDLMKAGAHDVVLKNQPKRLAPVISRELKGTITRKEKRFAENALLLSEKRFNNFFENGITGNYRCTIDGDIIDFNPQFMKMLGFESVMELAMLNIKTLIADFGQRNAIVKHLKSNHTIEIIEQEWVCKDGKKIVCIENITGIFNSQGELDQLLGYLIDVTNQKYAEKALMESEFRYSTLFSEMLEGFALHEIICNSEGSPVDYRFLNVNPAFERMTGLLSSDLINHTVKEVMPDTESSWIEKYGMVALTAVPMRFEDYSGTLGRHYQVVAYCPHIGQFATIITDITERKNAESLLIQGKARLIRGESVSKSGNWELYFDTGMISASDGAQKLYGLDGEKWSFNEIRNIPLPEYRERLDNALSQLVNHGIPYDIEYKIKQLKSGQIIDIHSIAEYDPSLKILFGVIQDITERKRTEEALLKSEENYRLLIENQGEGVATVDLNETFVFANPAADQMFGVPKGTLTGRNLFDFLIPGQIDKIKQQSARRALLEKSSYEIEIVNLQGESRQLLVTGTPQTNSEGKNTGTFGIFRDITESKNAQKELINSEKKYRELANSLPVCLFETDVEGGLTFANTTAIDWLGYTEAEFNAGMNIIQVVHESDQLRAKERFTRIIKEATHTTSEYSINRKDGTVFPVLASVFAVNKEGIVTGVRGTLVDISERKLAEKKLKLSEQNLSNLISNLPGFVYRCKNDKDWTMEYLSEGFSTITGYSLNEILELKSITFNDIIHPDYRNHLWESSQILLGLGTLQEEEYQINTIIGFCITICR